MIFFNRALEKAAVGICSDVHCNTVYCMIIASHYTEAAIFWARLQTNKFIYCVPTDYKY